MEGTGTSSTFRSSHCLRTQVVDDEQEPSFRCEVNRQDPDLHRARRQGGGLGMFVKDPTLSEPRLQALFSLIAT